MPKKFINTNMFTKNEFGTKDILIILLIFTLALSLRIAYFLDYQNTKIFPVLSKSDAYAYTLWAKDIASGDIFGSQAFMKWPLYAYFLGVLLRIFGKLTPVIFVQFFLGSLNCIWVYLIAKKIFNRKVGLISATLCIFYGLFIFYDTLFIYTSLSLFLNSIFFLAVLYVQDSLKKKNLFWLGIYLGICTITQGNILIFGVLAIAWVLISKKIIFREFVSNFFYFLFGVSLIVGSVTFRNHLIEKDFVLIQGNLGLNFYLGNNPQAKGVFFCPSDATLNPGDPSQEEMFRDARIIARVETGKDLKTSEVSIFWFRKSANFIKKKPLDFVRLFFKKVSYVFNPQEHVFDNEYNFNSDKDNFFGFLFMIFKFIFPFWILGMVLCLKRFRAAALLYILIFSLSFSIALFFVTSRYRMVIMPFAMIFAGLAIYETLENLTQRRFLKFTVFFIAALLLFFLSDYKSSHLSSRLEYFRNDPSDFNYHMLTAFDYENELDYLNAINELELANKIEPNNRRALFRLGVVYYNLKNFKLSEEKFKEVININDLSVDAYYNLGFIYNQQLRFPEAREMLEKAVFLDPDDPKAHFELALVYKSYGELLKARKEFNLSLKNLHHCFFEEREIIEKELKSLSVQEHQNPVGLTQ